MPRWITVRAPFDYHWPGRAAVTKFGPNELGDQMVKDEVADFAVAGGYATEGKLIASSRSRKGKRRQPKKRTAPAASTAELGTVAPVGDADASDADRPADRPAVDDHAD